jgi:DNA-directed RNA polymerase specialized sigma24 family protein
MFSKARAMNDHSLSSHSVTSLLQAVRGDDSLASWALWNRYVEKLVRLAQKRLSGSNRQIVDGDDIASEVFTEFLKGVQDRRFQQLNDRQDFWQVLAMLTERRVIAHWRREQAQKRGGGEVLGESALHGTHDDDAHVMHNIAGAEPTPEFAAEFTETLQRLMLALKDDLLKRLASDQLAGYTQEEMASRQEIAIATVQRKLRLIRDIWQQELDS